MKLDLDALKTEVEEQLAAGDFVVFHGYARMASNIAFVHWDCDRYPDFRAFLQVAARAGARLIIFHHREFSEDYIEDALERLEDAELSREERRKLEQRLDELRGYLGFTCALELSFDHGGRVYLFSLRTEWYEDLLDVLEEIDASYPDEDGEEDEGPMGGYFSRN
jgi:hypothetical protein